MPKTASVSVRPRLRQNTRPFRNCHPQDGATTISGADMSMHKRSQLTTAGTAFGAKLHRRKMSELPMEHKPRVHVQQALDTLPPLDYSQGHQYPQKGPIARQMPKLELGSLGQHNLHRSRQVGVANGTASHTLRCVSAEPASVI
jgi:hypothetical protein